MPAFASVSLNDGQATPVAHTFDPVDIDSQGIARWQDISGGIVLGYPTLTLLTKRPPARNVGNRNYKVTYKVVLPVLEQTSASTGTGIEPAPTLAYNLIATLEMVLPERSALSERKDVAAYLANFLSKTEWTSAVQNLQPIY